MAHGFTSTGISFPDGTTQTTAGTESKAAQGYVKYPSGLIIQWGTRASNGAVTFPITFPTACRAVVQQMLADAYSCVTSVTTTGFSSNGSGTSSTRHWIAAGY